MHYFARALFFSSTDQARVWGGGCAQSVEARRTHAQIQMTLGTVEATSDPSRTVTVSDQLHERCFQFRLTTN